MRRGDASSLQVHDGCIKDRISCLFGGFRGDQIGIGWQLEPLRRPGPATQRNARALINTGMTHDAICHTQYSSIVATESKAYMLNPPSRLQGTLMTTGSSYMAPVIEALRLTHLLYRNCHCQ